MEPVAANQRPDRLYTTSNGRPYTLAPMSRQHRLIHARDDSIVSSRHGMAAKTDFFSVQRLHGSRQVVQHVLLHVARWD